MQNKESEYKKLRQSYPQYNNNNSASATYNDDDDDDE